MSVCVPAHRICYRNKEGVMKAKMTGMGQGLAACHGAGDKQGCPVSSSCALQLGQPSPSTALAALPLLSSDPAPWTHTGCLCCSFSSLKVLKEGAEVTSAEQRWKRGQEVSELPTSPRKHRIEENELQGAGEVSGFPLVFP